MNLSDPAMILACVAICLVAVAYSAVGHGGASGYLAVLALLQMPSQAMSSTALLLNVLVATLAAWTYFKAGYLRWAVLGPYLLGSVPAAFLGGLVHLDDVSYRHLLAVALVMIAVRLFWQAKLESSNPDALKVSPLSLRIISGAAIGVLSGVLGIGGGVFLSPLILLAGWDNAKGASATAAGFIVVNSLAGLLARQLNGTLTVATFWPFLLAALLGGAIGSHLGAKIIDASGLRRLLALVLLTAAIKLIC